MLSSRQLLTFYDHLQKNLEAGLALPTIMESVPFRERKGVRDLAQDLQQGATPESAFLNATEVLPAFDREIMAAAGGTSGLPDAAGRLSEFHSQRIRSRNALWVSLLYPLILLHFMVVLVPVMEMIDFQEGGLQGGPIAYMEKTSTYLMLLWGGVATLWVLFTSQATWLYRIRRRIPITGKFQDRLALSHFCAGLGAMLDATVPVDHAWQRAGVISGSPLLERNAQTVAHRIRAGERPGAILSPDLGFPPDFIAYYRTAETTGKIPETLQQQSVRFANEARHTLKFLWVILPILVLLIVAGAVAFQVLRFFSQYLDLLTGIAP